MAPDGWISTTLGDFVALQRGHDLPEHRRRSGDVPILGSFGITGWHDEARAPGPGVTVGRSGASFGVVSYSPVDYWPLNTALFVTDFHGNDPRFAYYFLKCFDFARFNSGSAQPSLNRNYVHPVPVAVPPVQEQRAIARILGALDDRNSLYQRMNETLEAMARALFKSWYVDFDPVRAKAEGRDPGLPEPIASLFPDSFENSQLGEIPAGWRVARFDEVAELLREPIDPQAWPETALHHYSVPAFDDGREPKRELGAAIKSLKWRVPSNAILMSRLNPEIERVWIPDVYADDLAVCSTEFLVLRPKPPFTRAYVYCLARSPDFRQQVEGLVTGTSRSHQRAPRADILGLNVIMPPTELVDSFERVVPPFVDRTLVARRQSRTIAAIRDALLPKLISGEVRVPRAERELESAPV